MKLRRPSRPILLALGVTLASSLGGGHALAQAVERNLPRAEPRPDVPVVPPAPAIEDDATPIGPALAGLVVIGGNDAVEADTNKVKGIDLHRLERLAGADPRFAKFLGRPISQKLIAEIGAEVLTVYRDQGYPLINISTPPQDISDGVLRLRVLEFTLGEIRTSGTGPGEGAYLTDRIRMGPGKAINTDVLAEDLDWLNRYAFRQLTVAFSPSRTPGGADMTLQAETTRPWRVSAGYANSGSPQTGEDRYFVGAQARLPGLRDAVASYQGTVSGDAFENGVSLGSDSTSRYLSNGVNLLIPTLPRQALELTLNDIQTNQPFEAFVANSSIREASLAYRSGLSGLGLSLPGEVVLGLEARQSVSKINFGGVTINNARFDVFQAMVGYTWRGRSPIGMSQIVTALHSSPGEISDYNTDSAFSGYSAARFGDATYSYATAALITISPEFSTFGLDGLQIYNSLSAQYGNKAMPTTEQMGLGGAAAVRGYTLDDGAFDSGAVLRTELRHGTNGLMRKGDALATSLFMDVGYGKANLDREGFTAISVGAGVNYRLDQRLTLSVDVAVPLEDMGNTRSGQARVQTWLSASF